VQAVSWRLIFLINLPLAIAVITITVRHVPESRDPMASHHIDAWGAALGAVGLGALTYGLIAWQDKGLGSAAVVVSLLVGVGGLVAFVVRERVAKDPMLPLDIFASRLFNATNLVTFAVYAALGGVFFWLVLELQVVAGYQPLEAGISLLQAMDQVAGQLKPPISVELRRVLRDIRMGASPDDAYLALNERIKSSDLDLVVNAIIVQRSTGGNLAEILDKVAYIMRERIRIRGEIKTLTAQQQFSGYMLAGVPMFLLVVFRLLNPEYMAPMFDTTAGHVLLGIGGAGQFLAFFFVRKIVNIEV